MATILVVDDRPIDRQLLVTLLTPNGHRLLEAANGLEALAAVRDFPPDLAIADLLMPEMDGFEFAQRLRTDTMTARTRVLFYTAYYSQSEATALARSCGVNHLLLKPSEPQEILRSVDAALQGTYSPADLRLHDFDREHRRLLTNTLIDRTEARRREPAHCDRSASASATANSSRSGDLGASSRLTPRQREILVLLAQGRSMQQIAAELFVSVKTVETHRALLMDRLNIHNLAGLVRYAIRQGLVTAE